MPADPASRPWPADAGRAPVTLGAGIPSGARSPRLAWIWYWLVQPAEAAFAVGLVQMLRLLPVGLASATGDLIGRLGPLLASRPTRRSLANLALCFPQWSEERRRATMRAMWRHLGRVVAEYPFLDRLHDMGRVEIVGDEHIEAVYGQGRPIVFFSAHVGHWELSPIVGARFGMEMTTIYRPPSNRFIDRAIRGLRARAGLRLLPRGLNEIRQAMAVLASGGCLGMLVDQKRHHGMLVPLFGRPALTAPTLAQLALRADSLVMPIQVIRLRGCRFRICCYPPLTVPRTGDRAADTLALMTQVNAVIESWIRERPEQWLWPHRRWDA